MAVSFARGGSSNGRRLSVGGISPLELGFLVASSGGDMEGRAAPLPSRSWSFCTHRRGQRCLVVAWRRSHCGMSLCGKTCEGPCPRLKVLATHHKWTVRTRRILVRKETGPSPTIMHPASARARQWCNRHSHPEASVYALSTERS